MSQMLAADKVTKKRLYEFTFIANQNLVQNEVDNEVDDLIQELGSVLVENEAELVKYKYSELLDFTYLIDRVTRGYYCILNILAPPSAMNKFERKVKLCEDILRYFYVKVDEFHEGNSFIVQPSTGGRENE
ncbi:30S ribosomal protein S6 [Candidatus Mesenet endosymbiont of Agriotes lineatus]|uniref:30S ribosomal protein S6 n=1 Tax=Candidatus Mesenet endosymbiont of Agriotes lineatus TaxID=3077948 RepID=UPI0030CD0458